ncbi:hypothetical protein [Robiginitalea aurantiaca]|uniref:Uncharacterized protein n=1 Tax=Robiginitalea aurantiaca TaxID=3056915 RepID=A0ABT7WBT7_9FLAO|nr:hypothetical protein [Robiginitalea aurantiaca]MDM9630367.1 hypothetical protein [Robiginitalea aurantiaca]
MALNFTVGTRLLNGFLSVMIFMLILVLGVVLITMLLALMGIV